MTASVRLTLGPVLFNWPAERLRDFYARIADEAPVDSVCLGEVVCSKRAPFLAAVLPELIERLERAGKEVVLSSLALIMTGRELAEAEALAAESGPLVEANDMAVAARMAGRPFVAGPLLNLYNEGTLACLAAMGATRACLPAELPGPVIAQLAAAGLCEVEAQAFGRLPLAISARCYHARSRNLSKDGCQYVCAEDGDGMAVETLDEQPFLAVNGTQTLSGRYLNLLGELSGLRGLGVHRFRLWPHRVDMVAVAGLFRAVAERALDPAEATSSLERLCPGAEFANGYFHGRAGHARVEAEA